MTELKTLKDIAWAGSVSQKKLKQEAIKWINNYNAGKEYHDLQVLKKIISFEDSQIINSLLDTRIEWIKHFFNLTEADLGEKE